MDNLYTELYINNIEINNLISQIEGEKDVATLIFLYEKEFDLYVKNVDLCSDIEYYLTKMKQSTNVSLELLTRKLNKLRRNDSL